MTRKLHVIVCSTRPGRIGPSIGQWVHQAASRHGDFAPQLVDLADFDLPIYDEPNHPRTGKYEHEHTRRWSASVAAADAYAFVMPEYNFCPPPSFVNAVNYVYHEWTYKPAGIVSYGGISGGLRAAQAAKSLLTSVRIMPLPESVPIPTASKLLDEDRRFLANELHEASLKLMLDELVKWSDALKALRTN